MPKLEIWEKRVSLSPDMDASLLFNISEMATCLVYLVRVYLERKILYIDPNFILHFASGEMD